ncbi:MAG: hypothetical protein K6C34_00265, partial [Alphaproteobacteria bacterium]|nr:hypothetical protein [Alphaproteobacteria bacterium]
WLYFQNVSIENHDIANAIAQMLPNIVGLEYFWITDSKIEYEFVEQIIYSACNNETLKNIYLDILDLPQSNAVALVARIKRDRPDIEVNINGVYHIPSPIAPAEGCDSETEPEDSETEVEDSRSGPVKRFRNDSETEPENDDPLSDSGNVGSDTDPE